jgi:hypothetical protein
VLYKFSVHVEDKNAISDDRGVNTKKCSTRVLKAYNMMIESV